MSTTSGRRGQGEGSVHRRQDGRWAGTIETGYEGGKRTRKTVYGRSRAEVTTKLRDLQQRLDRNLSIPNDRLTLGEYLEEWLNEVVEASSLAPATKRSYRDQVRLHIEPAIGRTKLTKLDPRSINRWLNEQRSSGSGARTIEYNITVLRIALNNAVAWRLIDWNPAASPYVATPRRPQTPLEVPSVSEVQTLVRNSQNDRYGPIVALLAATGERRGEVLGHSWTDLDFDLGTLSVRQSLSRVPGAGLQLRSPKTDQSRRTLELAPEVVAVLRRRRRSQVKDQLLAGADWTDTGLIFTTPVGTPVEPRNFSRYFTALCERSGVRHIRVHDLRHFAAFAAHDLGIDLKKVQTMLGHSRLGTTADTYLRAERGVDRDSASRIARVVFGDIAQPS